MKTSKTLRLFSYEGDDMWQLKGDDKQDLSKANELWKDAKKKVGKEIITYPTNSVRCFSSCKKAKKYAKNHAKHWFYIVEFELTIRTITKMFDGIYGSDGPPCTIKKVSEMFQKT